MEALEKKSSKWNSTMTNFAGMATSVAVILGVYYTHQEHQEKREANRAERVMEETIANSGLLTSAEFQKYIDAQDVHRTNVEAFLLDLIASIDSALVIALPTLAETDREILRRLVLMETKLDAQGQPDVQAALKKVWQYLDKQTYRDSLLLEKNKDLENAFEKYRQKLRQGDRIE